MKYPNSTLYIYSTLYLCISFLLMSVVIFSWFTLTNHNKTAFMSDVAEIESEYAFYMYEDLYRQGNPNPRLLEQTCGEHVLDCYRYIENPMENQWIDHSVAPGQRFSLAIKVLSQGLTQSYLSLSLGGILSEGYELSGYKIETAFYYQVTKISYIIDDIESSDYKAIGPRVFYQGYFNQGEAVMYPLAKNLPTLDIYSMSSEMIIYFDLYFDPDVRGYDEGLIHDDSHVFIGQTLSINHLFMKVSLYME